MAKRARFLIIAALLTILEAAVVICYGWPAWTKSSGGIWSRGLIVLPATPGATSLANIRTHVVPAQGVPLSARSAGGAQTLAQVPAKARGQADV